ncbi:MAG: immunoglobulin domain-containing protein [Verrucomicrobia bacterium]|nr:immunoglobulin domain-containing protein [Verrucomicrobiota bacterium]
MPSPSLRRFLFFFAALSQLSTLHPQLLHAQQAPLITVQPTNQFPAAGATVSFSVAATGDEPLNYQWRKDGTNLANGGKISGATNATLTVSNLQTAEMGFYSLVVTNLYGAATSTVATLQLVPVVAWGYYGYHQTTIPSSLSNVVAIGTAERYSLALTAQGRVIGWGSPPFIPSGLSNVVAIAAGGTHCLALTLEGQIVGWGVNAAGQTTVPTGLSNVVAIAAGLGYSLALTFDGMVVGWGSSTVPAGLSNVVAIAAGTSHSLALTAGGRVVGWGQNNHGQATIPSGLSNIVAIAAGWYHSLALTADGQVVGWGDNAQGQASAPSSLSNVVAIAAGTSHSLALTADGRAVAWGSNWGGQTNIPSGLANVVAIAAGWANSFALTGLPGNLRPPCVLSPRTIVGTVDRAFFGRIVVLNGAYGFGASGLPPGLTVNPATGFITGQSSLPGDYAVTLFATNTSGISQTNLTLHMNLPLPGIEANGLVQANLASELNYDIGLVNDVDYLHASGLPFGLTVDPRTGLVSGVPLETGDFRVSLVLSNRHGLGGGSFMMRVSPVVGWGSNNYGQTSIPGGLADIVAIAAGGSYSLAMTAAGQVLDWVSSYSEQTNYPSGLSNVIAIAAGSSHCLALAADHRVVAWGDNLYGQTTIPNGLSNVVGIAAGWYHSLALTAEGRVRGWGAPHYGQTTIPRDLSNVVAIAAGADHSLALTVEGRVIGWGRNDAGQRTIPSGLSNVVAIVAGEYHSLALTGEGRVIGWGGSYSGQTNVPSGLSNVVAIAAGDWHSLALTKEGRVVGWGDNSRGQTTIPLELNNVVAIAAGSVHSLALVRPPGPRLSASKQGANVFLNWTGGQAPYQLQQCRELGASNAWENVGEPVRTNSLSLPLDSGHRFLRVRGP